MGESRQGFPRSARLHYGHEFAQVKNQGKRTSMGCLVLNWLDRPDQGFSRLGVITSKRVGNAVKRTRARRLIRECFRHHRVEFANTVDLVIVARDSIVNKNYQDVLKDFQAGLRKGRLLPKPV
jgi:ribonuclease P protein component